MMRAMTRAMTRRRGTKFAVLPDFASSLASCIETRAARVSDIRTDPQTPRADYSRALQSSQQASRRRAGAGVASDVAREADRHNRNRAPAVDDGEHHVQTYPRTDR